MFAQAGHLIISTIVGLYLFCVLLRFIFQTLRADFTNPLSKFLVTITNPPLKLLRRIIPGFGGIDIASLVLAFSVALIKVYTLAPLRGFHLHGLGPNATPGIASGLMWALGAVVDAVIWIFIIAMIIRVILSWVQPQGSYNPLSGVLYSLTDPILRPIRRFIPPIGGFDLSIIPALLVLFLAQIFIVGSIARLALTLS